MGSSTFQELVRECPELEQDALALETLAIEVLNGEADLVPELQASARCLLDQVCDPGSGRDDYLRGQLLRPGITGRELAARVLSFLLRIRRERGEIMPADSES